MCWSKNGGVRERVWKCAAVFSLLVCLAAGCAGDPWQDVPEFEMIQFDCPVPGGKFLDDANFVCVWSLLGPLAQTPGEGSRLHTEHVAEEALLNGNRRAPRGSSWRRISVRNDDPELPPGEVDFSKVFQSHPRGGKKSVFYACATLKCSRDYRGMVLHAAACGQVKVWINGLTVYARERGSENLRDSAVKVEGIRLHQGCNRLVVKYMDDGKTEASKRKFSIRFTDATGNLSVVR